MKLIAEKYERIYGNQKRLRYTMCNVTRLDLVGDCQPLVAGEEEED